MLVAVMLSFVLHDSVRKYVLHTWCKHTVNLVLHLARVRYLLAA